MLGAAPYYVTETVLHYRDTIAKYSLMTNYLFIYGHFNQIILH